MEIKQHLLTPAEYHPSPYQSALPAGNEMSLIVIHSMGLPAGEYGNDYIRQLFLGTLDCDAHPSFDSLRGVKVSAHLVIRRDASIMQFVPFNKKAWHAGESSYKGRSNCNNFSIGIEMEGSTNDTYTDKQYKALYDTCEVLLATYAGLDASRIAGHKEIAPGRKDDPWNFDWRRLRGLA